MPAYMQVISKPRCKTCGIAATHEVKNTYNAPMGYFCLKHGIEEVGRLNREAKPEGARDA